MGKKETKKYTEGNKILKTEIFVFNKYISNGIVDIKLTPYDSNIPKVQINQHN